MSQGTYWSSVYGKMQISGLTELFPFICTSAIWDQIPQSCFLSVHIFNSSFTERGGRRLLLLLTSSAPTTSKLLSNHCGGRGSSIQWITGIIFPFRSSFMFRGLKSLMAVIFLPTDMGGDISHFSCFQTLCCSMYHKFIPLCCQIVLYSMCVR